MDMFYAQVEILDNPELADVPMAVGTNKMISTASYKAREFGIKSAMPGFMAKQIFKDLVLIPERMWRYKEISKGFKDIL